MRIDINMNALRKIGEDMKDGLKSNWNRFLLLFIIFWLVYGDIICDFMSDFILDISNGIYILIEGNCRVSLGILIITSILSIYISREWSKDKDFRCHKILLAILIIVLLYRNPFIFAHIGFIDLRAWITICLLLPFIIQLISLLKSSKVKHESNNQVKFTTKEEPFELHKVTQDYIKQLASFIKGIDVSKSSFSIGISGGWGTGKTSFLVNLRKEIGESAYFVDFNPWQCNSPNQVIEDFFKSLRSELCKSHSSLNKPIREYVRSLSKFEWPGITKLALELSEQISHKDFSEDKEILSDRLTKLEKPVIVMIDDVDRLEQDEIFEVLRLIRNVGDLKNVIYVCAYDKDYVVQMLDSKSIKKPNAFLEKIFDIEIHLPKAESYLLIDLLGSELEKMIPSVNFEDKTNQFSQDDYNLIVNILGSFRGVKQFARSLAVNYSFIKANLFSDIDLQDFLWLELLNRYEKSVYDELYCDPRKYLNETVEGYVIKDVFNIKDSESLDYTKSLLNRIFRESHSNSGIRNAENFPKYFSLGIHPSVLSHEEFYKAIKIGNDKDLLDIIKQWCDVKDIGGIINNHFARYDTKKNADENNEGFVRLLLYFTEETICRYDGRKVSTVKNILAKENFKNLDKIKQLTANWFHERILSGGSSLNIAILLNTLYCCDNRDSINKQKESVINNQTITELFEENTLHYLETLTPDVRDVFNRNSELGRLIGYSCVAIIHDNCDNKDIMKNFALKSISQYFRGKVTLSNAEYDSLYHATFPEPQLPDNTPEDIERYNREMGNENNTFERYWGSDGEELKNLREALVQSNGE